MCGITGFLTRTASPAAGAWLKGMTRTLTHRGPDSEGTWCDLPAGIALGHRRLAIVDLSPAGHQPMRSATGRYVIVFNGEIYNFHDLRKELEDTDAATRFRGHSDTEVMLACFERWGVEGSLARFNGMFAFAVWDARDRKLHLARDPLGEKPLYYALTPKTLLFGSELKALRVHPDCPHQIDPPALALYLEYGYVPAPHSVYKNVFKLLPGTMLTVPADLSRQTLTRYWSFKDIAERGCADPLDLGDEEAIRLLERLATDAVRIRMIADVPLGAFLSGGIDSSLIVALMQSLSSRPVKSFTIGFHEAEYNEAAAAKQVARHLQTEHTEWYVTPADALAVIPRLPALYDEPFADSSQIPTFLVSTLARRHVTVSLSGDGGDELFAGYRRYLRVRDQWRIASCIPASIRSGLSKTLRPFTSDSPGLPGRTALALLPRSIGRERLRKFAALAQPADRIEFYDLCQRQWWGSPVHRNGANGIFHAGLADSDRPRCSDFLHEMMAADTLTYLPDDILVKVDRAAMGVSLESRIPLLDPRIVQLAWRLPIDTKLRLGRTKWILRRLLRRYLPESLIERPKSGFAVPVGQWLRGPLRHWAEDLLDAASIDREGYLESAPIRWRWEEHLAGKHNHSGQLWAVLMFQSWLRNQHPVAQAPADAEPAPASVPVSA